MRHALATAVKSELCHTPSRRRYDALFALVHRSLHAPRSPGWWKALHRTHHTARRGSGRTGALAPLETVQHSFMDGFLQVGHGSSLHRRWRRHLSTPQGFSSETPI